MASWAVKRSYHGVSTRWKKNTRWKATYGVVVAQKLVKEIDSLITDEALILGGDERAPRLAGEAREDLIVLRVEFDIVLVQVLEELLGTENLSNLYQLVRIAVAVEERLLAEDHRRKHRAQGPHVQGIIVFLEIDEQLRAFEIA